MLEAARVELEEKLRHLLLPRDPPTTRTSSSRSRRGRAARSRRCSPATCCACTCGYAERVGWKTEIIDATESDLGGYKDVSVAVKARGTPAPGEASGRG